MFFDLLLRVRVITMLRLGANDVRELHTVFFVCLLHDVCRLLLDIQLAAVSDGRA